MKAYKIFKKKKKGNLKKVAMLLVPRTVPPLWMNAQQCAMILNQF